MDDRRLKATGDGQYFEELLARIRDIRSSERAFWHKIAPIARKNVDHDSVIITLLGPQLRFSETNRAR